MSSVPTTKRIEIIQAMVDRLAAISSTGGFATSAGQTIFVGEVPTLGDDDPDVALAVQVGDEAVRHQGAGVAVELPVAIVALVKAGAEEAWRLVELALGDIQKAVELEDRTLGGLAPGRLTRAPVQVLEREPGSRAVGLIATYLVPFTESWGAP